MVRRVSRDDGKPIDHLYAVILAGGSGTRFWPLSRELHPKQLLKVLSDQPLIQRTVQRVRAIVPAMIVVSRRSGEEIAKRLAAPRRPTKHLRALLKGDGD